MGMRLDFLSLARKLVGHAGKCEPLAPRRNEGERQVGVRDDRLLQVFLYPRAAASITRNELNLHARAVFRCPWDGLFVHDVGLVAFRIDSQVNLKRGTSPPRTARDDDRFSGCQLPVETGRTDPDALLSPRLLQSVKLRAVEKLSEDFRDLWLHDAGSVVFHNHAETRWPRRRSVGPVAALRFLRSRCLSPSRRPLDRGDGGALHFIDFNENLRQNPRFLAGVERVVDGLLHRRQKRLCGIVESEEVPVFCEEFADRNLPLLRRHRFGGGPPFRFVDRFALTRAGIVFGLRLRHRIVSGPRCASAACR